MSALPAASSLDGGGSSRPTYGIALISTSADRRRSRSPMTAVARLPSARSKRASTSNTADPRSGFDEMDEVSGDGSAELLDDGTIEVEFAYHNGDEAVLKAKRDTSSTAC